MADTTIEKDRSPIIERRCRIVIEVEIRISEITPENVADYFTPDETGEGLPWEWAERQNRLLSAMLKDEENLNEFLSRITRDDLEMLIESVHEGYRSDDELFEKIYSRMGSEDALYFQEAKAEGLLDDNLALLDKAFVIDWKRAEIKDVCVVKGA